MKLFYAIKNFFFRPSRLGLGVLLLTGAFAGLIGLYLVNTGLKQTMSEEFCVSCHSMKQPQEELKERLHWSNKFGVTAKCADCHVPHEPVDMLLRKAQAAKELFIEVVTDKYDEEGSFEKHRLEMAEREWERMKANNSQECKNCHRYDRMRFDEMSSKARRMMIPAAKKDQACIDCHKGISHHLPKPKGIETVEKPVAGTSYSTKEGIKIYLDETKQQQIGDLEAGVPVKFIKSAENADLIEFELWSQNSSRVLLHGKGLSITDAILTKEFKEKAQYEVVEKERKRRTRWEKIKLQAWIEKSQLISDVNLLWTSAEKTFKSSCSACHKAPEPSHHTANQWVALFSGMVGFTNIDPETTGKQVLRYLQMHSSDFKKHE